MPATALAPLRPEVVQTLANLEQANALLVETCTLQQAKQIHDFAKAMRVFAAEQRLGREVKDKARAVIYEALRCIGQLLEKTERAPGGQPYQARGCSTGSNPEPVATLAQLGIDKKTSWRAQQLARLPEHLFGQIRDGETTFDKARTAHPEFFKPNVTWDGMPDYSHADLTPWKSLTVHFETQDDLQRFAETIGQPLTDDTKFVWFPKVPVHHPSHFQWTTAAPVDPRYPVYVPTKGRWTTPLTIRSLERMRVPYFAVVQPQEADLYRPVVGPCGTILTLPHGLDGLVPARNWIRDHAIAAGATRHWQIDDNIRHFMRFQANLKIAVTSGAFFRIMEDFADRYENVAVAGPHYDFFQPARSARAPITLNTRVYSCSLVNHEMAHRWRDTYNDDSDLCLRALKDDWVVVLFNAFLCKKAATMTLAGGNTPIYEGDGRREMAESLKRQHPDCVTITKKWRRWQHQVDYRRFRSNELILKEGVVIPEGANEYGLTLITQDCGDDAKDGMHNHAR